MSDSQEHDQLVQRIAELEEKVDHLRFSRRVLMNLLERIEKEKTGSLSKLESENKKLQSNNMRFAKRLINKNRQIVLLEEELRGKQRISSVESDSL